MSAPVRAARLLLLATFVAGWMGSALGAPALLAFADHGHEVLVTENEGHREAVLQHDAPATDAGRTPDGSATEPPAHDDHTVHLTVLAPVVVAKPLPVPALVAALAVAWTAAPMPSVVVARPSPAPPAPSGPLDALRTTVLLV